MAEQVFKRLKSIRLSDQAVGQIQELIYDGHFDVGSKLPSEAELGERLRISRSSIREALRILESKGVIEVRPGSGAYVSEHPFSFHGLGEAMEWLGGRKETLIQQLEVREVLEGFAIATLATRVTDQVFGELQKNIQQREAAYQAMDTDAISAIDIEFHKIIAKSCGNQVVDGFIQLVVSKISCSNRAIVLLSSGSEASTHEHNQILEALQSKDPVLAEKAMRDHLKRVRLEVSALKAI